MENTSCFSASGPTGPASMSSMDPAPIELKRPHRGRSALLWGFENKTWGSAKRMKKRTQKAFSHHRRFSLSNDSSPITTPPGRAPVSLGPSSVEQRFHLPSLSRRARLVDERQLCAKSPSCAKAETGVSAGAALLLSQLGDHVCEREVAAGQS